MNCIVKSFCASMVALGLLGGCATGEKDEAACRAVKPGVVTTANAFCVMVPEDPVDPSVAPVEWKGQKLGLCCEGCRGKWNKLTDAQKDSAVAKAIAKKAK